MTETDCSQGLVVHSRSSAPASHARARARLSWPPNAAVGHELKPRLEVRLFDSCLRWGTSSAASGRSRWRRRSRREALRPRLLRPLDWSSWNESFPVLPVVPSVFMTNRAFGCLFWEVCSLKGLLEPGTVDRLGFWTGTRIRDEQWDRWGPHLEPLHGSPENPVRHKQMLFIGWNGWRWPQNRPGWADLTVSTVQFFLLWSVTWGQRSSWEEFTLLKFLCGTIVRVALTGTCCHRHLQHKWRICRKKSLDFQGGGEKCGPALKRRLLFLALNCPGGAEVWRHRQRSALVVFTFLPTRPSWPLE